MNHPRSSLHPGLSSLLTMLLPMLLPEPQPRSKRMYQGRWSRAMSLRAGSRAVENTSYNESSRGC